jgi:peptide/nickel transport system substrate-binding protein
MKRVFATVLVLMLAVLITGSVVAQDDAPNVLQVAVSTETDNLNPWLTGLGPSHTNIYLYLRGPWTFNDSGEIVPVLVEELPIDVEGGVTVNENGQSVVRFTLADWAVWSDGTPMTADDFVFPYEVFTDGLTPFVQDIFTDVVESVTVGDSDKEVVVTYISTQPDWYAAGFWPLPAHVLRPLYEEAKAAGVGLDTLDWNRAPTVGNGPFVFSEWVSGSYLRFARNDNFVTPPWFDEVVVSFYPDQTVVRALLQNGQADLSTFGQPSDVFDFQDDPNFVISSLPAGTLESWYLNLGENGNPALKDIRVRQALVMALDRQLMVDELLGGVTTIPTSFWYGTPWHDEAAAELWPDFDPEGAVALLAEAGWVDNDGDGICEANGVEGIEDGTPLVLTHTTTSATLRMDAQVLAQDILADSCIGLELLTVEPTLMLATLDNGGAQRSGASDIYHFAVLAARTSINAPNYWACDGIPTPEEPANLNLAHACWEDIDAMWETLGTETDPEVAQATASAIQSFMAENIHWIGMWDRPSLAVYTSQLENVHLVPDDISPFRGLFWQVYEWQRAE